MTAHPPIIIIRTHIQPTHTITVAAEAATVTTMAVTITALLMEISMEIVTILIMALAAVIPPPEAIQTITISGRII